MFYRRSAAIAAALTVAVASPVLAASGASAKALLWSEQTVFALGPNGAYVAEWMGFSSGWTEIGGPALQIYAGSAGVFATSPSTGDICEYNGTPGSWTVIGGPGAQFAEGAGHLYGLGPNDAYVAQWNGPGQGWTVIGGAASGIYAGPDGLVATAPGAYGHVLRYNGTPNSWTDIGGPPASAALGDSTLGDLAVGSGAVYRIDPPGSSGNTVIDEWTGGTSWTPIMTFGSGNYPANLIAGYDGVYLENITSTTDTFYKYNGTPNSWSPISTRDYYGDGLTPEVESSTNLYGETLDPINGDPSSTDVEVYSGSGSSWTVIGGHADGLAAGD